MELNDPHKKVLAILAEGYRGSTEFFFSSFATISTETKLDRKQVRKSCRFLARKGLARFASGLWTEDGEPAGSGYAATTEGAALAETLPRRCDGCGQHMVDPPSDLCPDCQAYRAHQS